MFYMFPVYDISLVVSKSTHQALLGPTPPTPVANHESIEIHPVELVPGPWVVKTKTVRADGFAFVLDGHDTGMLIPHIPNVAAVDYMLPLTMLSSSCTWPFVTGSRSADGKCAVGFFPGFAPFIYCDSPQPGGTSSKALEGKNAARTGSNSKRPQAPAKPRLESSAKGDKVPSPTLAALSDIIDVVTKIDGRGLIYIPPAKTVLMRVSFADFLEGWMRIAVAQAVKGLVDKFFAPVHEGNPVLFSRRVAERVAWKEIKDHAVHSLASTALVDGAVKSIVMDAKIKAPFGVYTFSFAEGKGTYLYYGEFDGKPWTFEFKGLGHYPAQLFQTKPVDILTQTPNVCEG
jgi:hypothetical protein